MNIPNKEDVLKKWAPILDNMGVTGSQANWMSEYAEMHSKNDHWGTVKDLNQEIGTTSNKKNEDFQTLLPIAMKISAQTIGTDLVSVAPMGGGNSGSEMDAIRKEVKAEKNKAIFFDGCNHAYGFCNFYEKRVVMVATFGD